MKTRKQLARVTWSQIFHERNLGAAGSAIRSPSRPGILPDSLLPELSRCGEPFRQDAWASGSDPPVLATPQAVARSDARYRQTPAARPQVSAQPILSWVCRSTNRYERRFSGSESSGADSQQNCKRVGRRCWAIRDPDRSGKAPVSMLLTELTAGGFWLHPLQLTPSSSRFLHSGPTLDSSSWSRRFPPDDSCSGPRAFTNVGAAVKPSTKALP